MYGQDPGFDFMLQGNVLFAILEGIKDCFPCSEFWFHLQLPHFFPFFFLYLPLFLCKTKCTHMYQCIWMALLSRDTHWERTKNKRKGREPGENGIWDSKGQEREICKKKLKLTA